ncbi:hypothetical protein BaRGS_00027693 [Batillaria attramentaria]|uniref:Acyl-CoA-binding domain-containing protein 5 n=1 Tax=Batillaria attramentaria TaxID=370345 RepID=A0ABD0K115_9CAEN
MAATAQEKFDAAVKVIRGLPKNGSFQPSHEMMLKFYAYYKQATEGPCTAPKPGIWNLVNRKKWEAWAELGEMPKEQAMLLYVDELKNIVEMMPQTEQVADFVQTLGEFYELVEEGSRTKVTKHPNGSASFNGSGDSVDFNHSDTIGEMLRINDNDKKDDDDATDPSSRNSNGMNGIHNNGSVEEGQGDRDEEEEDLDEDSDVRKLGEAQDFARVDSGSDTDEFCDTSDQLMQIPLKARALSSASGRSQLNASTPVDTRREARVRFAPDSYQREASNGHSAFDVNGNNARTVSSSDSQQEKSVMINTEFPPRHLTDSLFVNDSCSSLASLVGDASVTGDLSAIGDPSVMSTDFVDEDENCEDGSTLDGGISFIGGGDLVTNRGGGEEEGGATQVPGGAYPPGYGRAGSYAGSGRDSNRSIAGSSRRGLFPSGSGGGGQRRGGDGRDPRGGSGLEEQMLVTLLRLQQDMVDVVARLSKLEADLLQRGKDEKKRLAERKSAESGWWPFPGLSKKMTLFIFLWPFVVPFIINLLCRRR